MTGVGPFVDCHVHLLAGLDDGPRSVADAVNRRDQGFALVALGADMTLLVRALRENLAQLGRDVTPHLSF